MSRTTRALAPALGLAVAVSLAAISAAHAGGRVTSGSRLTLVSGVSLSGYDAVTDRNGTTYVGWIGDNADDAALRQVHLCVLPAGASGCAGGVQTADAIGESSAAGLRVVDSDGQVSLVWIAQPTLAVGDLGGVFGIATVSGTTLGASAMVPGAPSNGSLYSAIAHPGGGISLGAVGASDNDSKAYYYPTVGAPPAVVQASAFIGNVQLADNGKQTVLTTSAYGSLSGKVSVTSKSSSGTSFGPLKTVAHSYTGGGIESLRTVGSHIWMVGMSDKELYAPYTYRWTGSTFGAPVPTGDHNDISTIDTTSDSSGRLAVATTETDGIEVTNVGSQHGTSFGKVKVSQTYAGGPAQLSTSPSGRGWVIYGIEVGGTPAQILLAQPVKLPAVQKTVHAHNKAGRLSLTGPASCLPVSSAHVKLTATPAPGWKVDRKSVHLGSKSVGGSINGASLSPHHSYTLKAKVVFAKGGARSTLDRSLAFTTCPRP